MSVDFTDPWLIVAAVLLVAVGWAVYEITHPADDFDPPPTHPPQQEDTNGT